MRVDLGDGASANVTPEGANNPQLLEAMKTVTDAVKEQFSKKSMTLAELTALSPDEAKHRRRFFSKVEKQPGEGCWIWKASKMKTGYGYFWNGQRVILAHHYLVWPVPKGMYVCHKCDNPSCVNPDHVFFGTHGDNVRDMFKKGRQGDVCRKPFLDSIRSRRKEWACGEANYTNKLTEAQAMEALYCPQGGASAMARRFGVTVGVITGIRKGTKWAHLQKRKEATKTKGAE